MSGKLVTVSLVSAFVLCGWARARALLPDARRQAALSAFDSQGLERLQYELLYLTSALELQPCANLLKGKLLLAAKEPLAALDQLDLAAARKETQVRALVLMGEALYRLGRLVEAGETWTRALEIAPDDIDANRWLGVAYYDLGAMAEAFRYLRKVASLAPDDARPHRVMGLLHSTLGEATEAVEAYQESLRLDPDQPEANSVRLELAEVFYRLGRSKEAIATLDLCPVSADVVALRAACRYRLGDVDKAFDLSAEALSLDPLNLRALTLRGNLLLVKNEPQEAAECLERASRSAPRDLEVLNYLVKAYQRLHDARADGIQRVLLEMTRLRDVYARLAEQAAKDPRDAEVRAKLGLIATQMGQTDRAKSWFRASLDLDPNNQAVASALQNLRSWGDPSESIR